MALDSQGNYVCGLPSPTLQPNLAPAVNIAVDSVAYPGPPTIQPPACMSIVVDSNMRQWQFNPTTGNWQ